jgi:hypothetical protein
MNARVVDAARGGVRDGGPVLRRQGESERVVGQGGVAGGVQPLPDLGHLRLIRQRPQHHRGWVAGELLHPSTFAPYLTSLH